jgi:Ras-related protein Rab-11A
LRKESLNVESAFTKVLTQIYGLINKKALDIDIGDLPKEQTIKVGFRGHVSALLKKAGI